VEYAYARFEMAAFKYGEVIRFSLAPALVMFHILGTLRGCGRAYKMASLDRLKIATLPMDKKEEPEILTYAYADLTEKYFEDKGKGGYLRFMVSPDGKVRIRVKASDVALEALKIGTGVTLEAGTSSKRILKEEVRMPHSKVMTQRTIPNTILFFRTPTGELLGGAVRVGEYLISCAHVFREVVKFDDALVCNMTNSMKLKDAKLELFMRLPELDFIVWRPKQEFFSTM